ncbi:MAG: DNA alkylation repair protein [bacterium]|nr:DNA alkylation repair protein [bacterium]
MDIKEELFKLRDIKYKEFHSRLCPKNDNIIGIRVPILKKLAKFLYNQDNEILLKIGDDYYEEIMLQGLIIAYLKKESNIKIPIIKKFVKKIDNWAVCDTFCSSIKIKDNDKDKYLKFIKTYSKSKKEFELRFMLVMLLDHYLEEKYIDNICEIINEIYKKEYYVLMAISWLLSSLYIKYPNIAMKKIDKLNIDKWTYNKTIQKIIESSRICKEQKEYLKTLKK